MMPTHIYMCFEQFHTSVFSVCVFEILLVWFIPGEAGCLPGRADKDWKESEVHFICGRGGREAGGDEEGEGQSGGLDHFYS